MRKFIAILLATSVIAGTIHMDEVAKLPLLLRHYAEHKATGQGETIFDFLYKHYSINSQPDTTKDTPGHSQLPFKSGKSLGSHFGLFAIEIRTIFLKDLTVIRLEFPDTGIKTEPGFSAVWQPPKVA